MEEQRQEEEPKATKAAAIESVKNWAHIQEIRFSGRTRYQSDSDRGDFMWVACQDNCRLTITRTDQSLQRHIIPKGGGIEKRGDTLVVYAKSVFKTDG